MGANTGIQWTNRTWNPLTGCTRVSPGCDHCYAFELHDMRYQAWLAGKDIKATQYHRPFSEIQLFPDRLTQPLHWRKPSLVFVNSMSDLFHSQVPDEFIRQVFDVMQQAHWHTFQVLAKRPGRLRHLWRSLPWPRNVWIGVSVESQPFVRRADVLRDIPAAVKFLSCEPLLGSLNLSGYLGEVINWCIVGGESGAGHRQMNAWWVHSIKEQCQAANVPLFFKQWGGINPKSGGDLLDGKQYHEWPVTAVEASSNG